MFLTELEVPAWLTAATVIGFDVETTGLALFDDEVTAIAISDGVEAMVVDVRQIDATSVCDWLQMHVFAERRVIGHNLLFDLPRLALSFGCAYPERLFDTFLAEALLTAGLEEASDEAEGDDDEAKRSKVSRSLQAAAQRRLGLTLSKEADIRTGFTVEADWTPEMLAYAAEDARVLVALAHAQTEALAEAKMTGVARIEFAALPVFCEMVRRGVRIDATRLVPLVDEAAAAADRERLRLEALLTRHVLWARKRRNAGVEAKLVAWLERQRQEKTRLEQEWDAEVRPIIGDDVDEDAYGLAWGNLYRWNGVRIKGAAHPVTPADIDGWLDPTPRSKTDATPKGRSRYVKKLLQHWATTEAGTRPSGSVIDVTHPINIRSQQQKMAAIADLCEEFNAAHGTHLTAPDNLRRGTLVGWALDAPPEIYEQLVGPLLEFSRFDKLVSAFGQTLLQKLTTAQTLHGQWAQMGTATGRPSCTAPNLLALPKTTAFRAAFRARPDHVFIVADYSQMELRELAEFSGDAEMIAAFQQGVDLHTLMASRIFSLPLEAVSEDQRKRAKIVNFGVAYGMASRSLQRNLLGWGVRVTEKETASYLTAWRETFSTAAAWLEKTGARGLKQGFTATPLGRRRYFMTDFRALDPRTRLYRQGKVQREAANHPIQGGNADVTKLAMAAIQHAVGPWGGSVVLQVYDEIVTEVPQAAATTGLAIVETCMLEASRTILRRVPSRVDAIISASWSPQDRLTTTPELEDIHGQQERQSRPPRPAVVQAQSRP